MEKVCPVCGFEHAYQERELWVCPVCGHEWKESSNVVVEEVEVVKDAYGTSLNDGDSVTLIKDLKVKGASNPIKQGTLVKNITLTNEAGQIGRAHV